MFGDGGAGVGRGGEGGGRYKSNERVVYILGVFGLDERRWLIDDESYAAGEGRRLVH